MMMRVPKGFYCGTTVNGVPNGHGYIMEHMQDGWPIEEGYYKDGRLVNGDVYLNGHKVSSISLPSEDEKGRPHGYGTHLDSDGNLHTGEWFHGYTEEEFEETWNDIN